MDIRFNCPLCGQHLCVEERGAGMIVNCPGCNGQIEIPFSTASEAPTISGPMPQKLFAVPTKLPFLKSHRKEILEAKVSELVSLGPIDQSIEAKLQDFAVALGLEKQDATADLIRRFTTEFEPIKKRTESSFVLTDSDLGEIETLKKKYNVNLTLRGNASLFRAIYLLEAKHELPEPIRVDVF
jgi:hypothetical protein